MAHIDYLRDEAARAWTQSQDRANPYRSAAFLRWTRCARRVERMERLGIVEDEPAAGYDGGYADASALKAEQYDRQRSRAIARADAKRIAAADELERRSAVAIAAREAL